MGLALRLGLGLGGVSSSALAAALSLDFTTGSLDALLTASGGANGTRVNSSGDIVSATAPRFDYNPVTLAARGLLIEEQRTNLIKRSAELDNATWGKSAFLAFGSGSTANAINGPDGTLSADLLTEDTATTTHRFYQGGMTNMTASTVHTESVYYKPNGRENFYLWTSIPNNGSLAATGGSNPIVVGGLAGDIKPVGNGFFRSYVNFTSDGTNPNNYSMQIAAANGFYSNSNGYFNSNASYAGNGVSGGYYWGAQVEAGAFPTSYIATTSAQVTRTADSITCTGSNFSGWWNASAGTVVITADSPGSGTRIIWQADDGTANNRITVWTSGTDIKATIVTGGVTQADVVFGVIVPGVEFEARVAWTTNDLGAQLDGAAEVTDTSLSLPTVDRCRFGSDTTGNYLCGHIKSFNFYASRLAEDAPINLPLWAYDWWNGATSLTFSDYTATAAIDSVGGSDSNAGTEASPKQNLTAYASLSTGTILGLKRGSTWRQSIPVGDGSVTPATGIAVTEYGTGALPVVSGFDAVPNGSWTNNGDGTYSYSWTADTSVANDGYSNVMVIEIDGTTVGSTPYTARSRMTEDGSAPTVAGHVYITNSGLNFTARIKPSDGAAPGTRYSYEVTKRYNPADWFQYNRDGGMAGLVLLQGSHGYGIAGPDETLMEKVAIVHGTTHHAVIAGGEVKRLVMAGRGDSDAIGLTFYKADATGLSWSASEVMGYETPSGFYSHNSGGSGQAYTSGTLQFGMFKRSRDGTALKGEGINAANTNTVSVDKVYVEGFKSAIGSFLYNPTSVSVTNIVARKCGRVNAPPYLRNGLFQLEEISDSTDANSRYPECIYGNSSGQDVQNCLWNVKYGGIGSSIGSTIQNAAIYGTLNNTGITIRKNIFVIDVPGNVVLSTFSGVTDWSEIDIDYNIIIMLAGTFEFNAYSGADPKTWAFWKYKSGQDANSLFLNYSGSGKTIADVFVDAANGDFRWANTGLGATCDAYCRAHNVGPEWQLAAWPTIPTVDDAIAELAEL